MVHIPLSSHLAGPGIYGSRAIPNRYRIKYTNKKGIQESYRNEQSPIECMVYMNWHTDVGELVMDPMAGTMPAGIDGLRMNRPCKLLTL